ncbi:protein ALTERED PHOSPHATE STARVATION RESPONSE 1 [Beta vulgaris subsp. vulgaris]|uniref:protein ALTERED PHOSPHATE STARVATION RESPONSE 1 n=1 Tax=Beta vulgaris subsp. vulgaris TaxID=3555 RepID=UPI0020374F34|nr:protein ALTERED PHOSPHATE STARVATION RESPONSE 1 [Beta vulgaris subsp. vulgaris]
MGCVASRLEDEEEVVAICRERKKLMKLAVERRYALADAHCKYCHSLYAVSAAIKLFVARHSTPSSPFLITFPPPNCGVSPSTNPPITQNVAEKVITNPMFLQQNPSHPTQKQQQEQEQQCCESSPVSSTTSSLSSSSEEEEAENVGGEEEIMRMRNVVGTNQPYGYYYMSTPMSMSMSMPPPMPSPQRDYGGWDFFNPFSGVRNDVVGAEFQRHPEEELRAVREEEGIPELEEERGGGEEGNAVEEKCGVGGCDCGAKGGGGVVEHLVKGGGVDVVKGMEGGNVRESEKGLTVIDQSLEVEGRELLNALKDIEDHFIRAYDSGKDVSKMLEANKMHMQSGLEEIKENSTKLIQAITWHRSNTLRSSSCKSLVASSSKNSTSWTEYKNDLFDDYGGMSAGSHSLTLGRLYAWEKKLYEEVKAGDTIRKLYERKCAQLRNKDVKGEDSLSVDKTRAAVKDLYSRILVAIRRAESISEQIQKLADEELQPQIIELLQGLTQSWKIMMESHETQNHIIFEVRTFDCPTYGKFCNDSHRLATLQLEAEIQNWRECFSEYVAAQKSYVEVLHGWLSKFIVPEVEFGSKSKSFNAYRAKGPPLYIICRDWLTYMENLPDKAVSVAMKSFVRDVRGLWVQQGEEQDQKRKVDKMAKELEKKMIAYQKVEGRIHESTKFLEYKPSEIDAQSQDDTQQQQQQEQQTDYLLEKKDALDTFKRRLEFEKEKHHNFMEETQRITLNGFQTGFSLIFDAMVHFSKASLKMYNDLVNDRQHLEKGEKQPSLQEGSYVNEHLK